MTDPATTRPDPSWTVTDTGVPKRAVLLVSKELHCLHDLLGRVAAGELPVRLEAVIGNHDTLEGVVRAHGVDFHHVPFPADPDGKAAAFAEVGRLVDKHEPDAVVLARFMQILPASLCERWAGRALNIHHSFLPSFVGARPYHQAHVRGVKLIGATCHYVTADLDAGPIVEQDVIRVDHGDTVADMVRRGPRHRAAGAGPRPALAPGGPGAGARQQDRRLPVRPAPGLRPRLSGTRRRLRSDCTEMPRSLHPEPRREPAGQAGLMLMLRWKTLPGSYSALIRASRSYLAPYAARTRCSSGSAMALT